MGAGQPRSEHQQSRSRLATVRAALKRSAVLTVWVSPSWQLRAVRTGSSRCAGPRWPPPGVHRPTRHPQTGRGPRLRQRSLLGLPALVKATSNIVTLNCSSFWKPRPTINWVLGSKSVPRGHVSLCARPSEQEAWRGLTREGRPPSAFQTRNSLKLTSDRDSQASFPVLI